MFKKVKRVIKSKWLGFKIKRGWVARGRAKPEELALLLAERLGLGGWKKVGGAGAQAKLKGRVTISARVIRKDGTVEDRGVVFQKEVKKDGES